MHFQIVCVELILASLKTIPMAASLLKGSGEVKSVRTLNGSVAFVVFQNSIKENVTLTPLLTISFEQLFYSVRAIYIITLLLKAHSSQLCR